MKHIGLFFTIQVLLFFCFMTPVSAQNSNDIPTLLELFDQKNLLISEDEINSLALRVNQTLTSDEERELVKAISLQISPQNNHVNYKLLSFWFSLSVAEKYPDIAQKVIFWGNDQSSTYLMRKIVKWKTTALHPEWIEFWISRHEFPDPAIVVNVLSMPHFSKIPEFQKWGDLAIKRGQSELMARYVLSMPHSAGQRNWLLSIIHVSKFNPAVARTLIEHVLSKEFWNDLDYLYLIVQNPRNDQLVNHYLLNNSIWSERSELKEMLKGLPVSAKNIRESLSNYTKNPCETAMRLFITSSLM